MSYKFDSGKVEKLVENILEIKRSRVEAVLIDWILTELDACRDLSEQVDTSIFFEKIWKAYPNKRGKSGVSTKAKKELMKAGLDTVMKSIDNYKRLKPSWANWLDGSTFFNGRWKDYVNPEAAPPKAPKKKAGNYAERVYDPEYLNGFIGRDED